MRILHLGKYFPPAKGGMERFLADLVAAQRRAGDEPAVLVHAHAPRSTEPDPPWLLRCPVWVRLIFAPLSPLYPFWLARAIRTYRPDVLHIHMPNVSPFWALLLPAARRLPWIVHWHSDVEPSKFKRSLRLAYPHYRIFERAVLERAEAVVVTSPQYLEASKPLVPWRYKCHVVPLGVAPERLPEIAPGEGDAAWQPAGMRVLAVGRLTYYKAFETLVRAVAASDALQLVLVGEGEERGSIEAAIAGSGAAERIRLAGELDDAALCRMLASCDVLCLPSCERTEAFGLVLVEAMRYGKPLVVSDLPGSGMAYVARQGQNAIAVRVGDAPAWTAALEGLAQHPAQRQLLGRLGRERFVREFDVAQVAARLHWLYALALRMRAGDSAHIDPIATDELPGDDAGEAASAAPVARLLAVIPALNEAACIGEVIVQVRRHGVDDVLVVDDGSTDDTAAIAILNGARVLRAPLWQGAWGAIQTGIRYALRHGYSGVVTLDADGQHEPLHLPRLLEASRTADVVIAACPSRGSRLRQLAWRYFRLLTGFGLEDLTSGFRYYSAGACRVLQTREATLLDYQDIGVLLLLRSARLSIAEVPVEMNARRSGASRVFFSWWTVARYMTETSLLCLARWDPRRR
jgi:glycosyltransferase involved in cell wall biosynthesis